MNPDHSIMLASLLGFLLIGCEKVPTFQELTGQEAKQNSPAVVNSPGSGVTPAKPVSEVVPIQPTPVVEDPAALMAVLTRKTGTALTDREIARATKLPSIVEELKSLDVSQSAVTDEGIRLLGQFTALMQVNLTAMRIDGAGIEGLEPLSNLRELTLANVKMGSSAGWQHLGRLPQIEKLDLSLSSITDADVSHLLTMTGLKELDISGTALTDAALNQLAKLESLEVLRMEGTRQIHGSGLKAFVISKRKPGLRWLYASNTPLTKEGLGNVKRITSLEVFDNTNTQLTDQLLFELKGATNLKTLVVGSNNLTDASGLTIRTMRNLESLNLRQCSGVNAPMLTSLATLTELRTLDLTRTSCPLRAVQEFRQKRKNCEVIFDDNPSQ